MGTKFLEICMVNYCESSIYVYKSSLVMVFLKARISPNATVFENSSFYRWLFLTPILIEVVFYSSRAIIQGWLLARVAVVGIAELCHFLPGD